MAGASFLANGISIPSSYTAYLAPLSSSKLYNEVQAGKNDKASETPYVVMFQAVNILSGHGGGNGGRCGPQIQECWEFEHPRRDVVLNDRGKSLLSPSDMSQCALSGADCFDATCPRVTAHEQPQHSVRDADVPHPSRWDTPWARWLLRGGVIWGGRAQYTSDPEGTCFQGHAELVPAVLPPKGKAHPHTHIACRSVLPPPCAPPSSSQCSPCFCY